MLRETEQPGDREAAARNVRARIAFQHMVAASIAGAAISGTVAFIASIAASIVGAGFGLASLVEISIRTLIYAFVAFLIAFGSSVVVGAPLFLALDEAKVRKGWPWFVAAPAIGYAAYVLISGRVMIEATAVLQYMVPGLLIACLFVRRMQPLWRAAEREVVPSLH